MTVACSIAIAVVCSITVDFEAATALEQQHARLKVWKQVKSLPKDSQPAELARDEIRFLFALRLLEPRLSWRVSHVIEPDKIHRHDRRRRIQVNPLSPWHEAHQGDALLLSVERRQQLESQLDVRVDKKTDSRPFCYWSLKDPRHADVLRAIDILRGVTEKRFVADARRWVADLERNNTVMTFDIPGACFRGKDAPLAVDVRNVGQLRCKLYRVESLELLAWFHGDATHANHLGHDFVYRDFGLQFESRDAIQLMEAMDVHRSRVERLHDKPSPMPQLPAKSLLAEWNVDVATLKTLDAWRRRSGLQTSDRWTGQPDAHTFDDECELLRSRLEYEYIVDGDSDAPSFTSWHANRVLTIPGKHLQQSGAYLLVAEANGQRSFAPLLVDPLSLTLRRCRDGVMAIVSSMDGKRPAADADIVSATKPNGVTRTDKNGVAFCRAHGLGTTAFLAQKDGRFAVGGFGQVFEAVYFPKSRQDEARHAWQRMGRKSAEMRELFSGFVYADQFLAAAWTDRPVYRPGQTVHFKLLLRRFDADNRQLVVSDRFRADDFDIHRRLVLPRLDTQMVYGLLDPRGRHVAGGQLGTNDFGTVVGSLATDPAAALGEYALRLQIDGVDRVIPSVFSLDHYRRDRFVLEIDDLQERLADKADRISFLLRGRYSFGKPLASVRVSGRLESELGEEVGKSFSGTLDARGELKIELRSVRPLDVGEYVVECTARDLSGRTVAVRRAIRVGAGPTVSPLDVLPRMARVGDRLTLKQVLTAVHLKNSAGETLIMRPNGRGEVVLTASIAGWHHVELGPHSKRVYFHDPDNKPPLDANTARLAQGWVNLSDYENHDVADLRYETAWSHGPSVLALFDTQRIRVGEDLPLHIFVDGAEPGARVLLTYEGRTVVDYHVVELSENGYHTIRLPIRPRHVPNFYLQARVINPGLDRDIARHRAVDELEELKLAEADNPTWCRVDVVAERGAREINGLKIQVTTDKSDYQPGEQALASVRVTDDVGKPVEAEVSLAVVDDTVFAHASPRESRIARAFTAARPSRRYRDKAWRTSVGDDWAVSRLDVHRVVKHMSESLQKLAEQAAMQAELGIADLDQRRIPVQAGSWLAWAKHGALPIQETPIPQLRRRADFRETAAWQPRLRTDAQGRASVSFQIPDSLTTYRLTAVGVTKDTKIGVADDGRLQVDLPLSVRIQTPRFAVEGDRLRLAGLLRNQTGRPRSVQYTWYIAGAEPRDPKLLTGTVTIKPASETAVFADVSVPRSGDVTVRLRIAAGEHSDEELRQFTVQAFGRARQVHFHGRAKDGDRVRWPDGFLAQELTVSLSRGQELTEALAGLEYLIAYPYGCVEQTMSRFLPAVVVNQAAQKHGVDLPDSVRKMLPEVLARGLTRLYSLQHEDGGWGWWEADKTNHRMTIYVLYGFARCLQSDVKIDQAVLKRGLDYLTAELKAGRLESGLLSRAWLVLALAGRADKDALTLAATGENLTPGDHCNFALATDAMRLEELSALRLGRIQRWDSDDSDDLALQLQTLLKIDRQLDRATDIAIRLAKNRRGVRWGNTRATSAAIEALSEYLARRPPVKTTAPSEATALLGETPILTTWHGGKTRPTFSQATGTDQIAFAHTVNRDTLRGFEITPPIGFAVDGDAPVYFSASASGVQRAEKLERFGVGIRLRRNYSPSDSAQTVQQLESVSIGDTVQVELVLELDQAAEYVLLEDRHPAGCEYAARRILGSARDQVSHVEFRDDRVCLFFTSLPAGTHRIVYELRADTPGRFRSLPAVAYPMYREDLRAESASSSLHIRSEH